MKAFRISINSIMALAIVSALWISTDSAMAQEKESGGTVIVDGLNGPQGVLAIDDGSIWVIDVGLGGDQEVEIGGLDPNTNEVIKATFGNTARVMARDAGGPASASGDIAFDLSWQRHSRGGQAGSAQQ